MYSQNDLSLPLIIREKTGKWQISKHWAESSDISVRDNGRHHRACHTLILARENFQQKVDFIAMPCHVKIIAYKTVAHLIDMDNLQASLNTAWSWTEFH